MIAHDLFSNDLLQKSVALIPVWNRFSRRLTSVAQISALKVKIKEDLLDISRNNTKWNRIFFIFSKMRGAKIVSSFQIPGQFIHRKNCVMSSRNEMQKINFFVWYYCCLNHHHWNVDWMNKYVVCCPLIFDFLFFSHYFCCEEACSSSPGGSRFSCQDELCEIFCGSFSHLVKTYTVSS